METCFSKEAWRMVLWVCFNVQLRSMALRYTFDSTIPVSKFLKQITQRVYVCPYMCTLSCSSKTNLCRGEGNVPLNALLCQPVVSICA